MSYKLRFVQSFKQEFIREYLALEDQFAALEANHPAFPRGTRYLPLSGKEPSNTLVWECDFDSLEKAQQALAFLLADDRHEDLFRQQSKYILGTFTEIYKPYNA
jgi:hypothetical protein